MTSITEVIKLASKDIKKLIERGDVSKSSNTNSTGDTQLKLDLESDKIIQEYLQKLDCVKAIVSEEQDTIIELDQNAQYLIAYDPLDGSSLVDVNLSVGSIYGIYEKEFQGSNLVCAVYVVFGPRTEMVVAKKDSVKLYRLIEDEFEYVQHITLNEKGNLNAPGSTQQCWAPYHKELIDRLFANGYRLRYSGGMVPDLHQILLKGGGLFSYPGTSDRPSGKLRLLFEVFPFAFVYENAGGEAIDGTARVLDVEAKHIHDTSPCFFGSKQEIQKVKEVYSQHVR
jgi:fructose-1,6-bisphosphatase I